MLLKPIGYLVAISAVAISLFGVLSSAAAVPASGVAIDFVASTVIDVSPGSPGWRDGIRPGHVVVEFRRSDEPNGWELVAGGGEIVFRTSAAVHEGRLRGSLPTAAVGVAVVVLGLLLILRSGEIGFALVPVGVALATLPMLLTGDPRDQLVGGTATFVLAGAALGVVGHRRTAGRVAVLLGLALGMAWIASLVAVPNAFDALDTSRIPAAAAFSLWGGWIGVDRRGLAQRLLVRSGPNVFDLVYLPGIVTLLVGAVVFLRLEPLVALAVLAAAVIIYPTTRRAAGTWFERLIIGNVRRQAEIRAIEDERGRLAREIHDAPLQELAAVIRRLEDMPEASGEATALREVAAQLRDVATTLHPPVLEDLGLAPALADLGDALAVAHPDRAIRVEVDDIATGGGRPDPDAEVAAFRIAQEAATNAIRHSGGHSVSVLGSVASDAIDLTVVDDGAGIDREAATGARRKGHFGLDSMRERAEAVGGQLTIESHASGVRIRFTWERST